MMLGKQITTSHSTHKQGILPMFPSDLLPITDNQLLVPSSWLLYQLPARIDRLPAAPCPPPQRNPVPFHPLCPMSSVSAWSTAAAARSATARARHESPVISAEIDDEVLDFSAIFSVYTDFLPFSGKGEGKGGTFSAFHHSIESFLMRTWKHME